MNEILQVRFYLYNAKGKKAVQQNILIGQAHPHGTHQVENFLWPISGILNDLLGNKLYGSLFQ